uniref:Uncharacterized protein n=1 Tax=Phlebotomus papatasi TaxID=29031 RepID=A0A1B0DBF5_PHLPP
MEKRKKTIPGKFHWLPVNLHREVRSILSSDWDQNKLIECMEFYIRNVPDGSLLSKKMQNPKITHCIKSMPGIMYLFKCLNVKFGPTAAYFDRMVKILQLYLDHELKASIQEIVYYVDIANKISLQIDVHLKVK